MASRSDGIRAVAEKILITGAAGFTGAYLARALQQQGHDVHGLVHKPEESLEPFVHRHLCDLMNPKMLTETLSLIQPSKIVHLAAISFVAHGNIEDIYRTNVLGSRNLLQAVVESATNPSAILMASSANIYGNQSGGILTEDHPAAPANDYAVSKIAMEYLCKVYEGRLPIIITRPFNYTGAGQNDNFLIAKIVDHISCGAPEIELGNLDVARDFSDVRAITAAYTALLNAPLAIGRTFNICSGRAHSLRDLLEMAQTSSGHSIHVKTNPAFVRHNEVQTLVGSRDRLDDLIPDLPNIPIEQTIGWMLKYNSRPQS